MSKFRVLCHAAALLVFLPVFTAHAQTVIQLGHAQTDTSAFQAGATVFADEVGKRTAGRFKIEVIGGGKLGAEKDLVDKVVKDTVDLALTSTGPIGNFVPEALVTDIPFLFRDYAHARKVMDGTVGQELAQKCADKGIVILAWGENGFRHLTNSKRAVSSAQDLKGLNIRTMENDVHIQAFRALGSFPRPIPFTELYGALESGSVDGEENPMAVIISANFGKVQKFVSLTAHVYSPAPFIASKKLMSSLSAADQSIFLAAAQAGAKAMRKRVSDAESSGLATLKAQGVAVTTVIDRESFVAPVIKNAYPQYEKRFTAEAIERIKAVK